VSKALKMQQDDEDRKNEMLSKALKIRLKNLKIL
jgi:hypothetical protein